LKVLIPTLGFARTGGARVLSELAGAWTRAGHHVEFLVPDTSADPYFPTTATILWVGSDGVISPSKPSLCNSKETGARNLFVLWRGLRKIARHYDVVLANHSLTPWPIWLAGADRRRVFYYIQAYEPEYFNEMGAPIKEWLSRMSYYLPYRQIVNADVYIGYENIAARDVVPFGIDLNVFHPRRTPALTNPSKIVLGCIGRSEPAKGTPYVLKAFEMLARDDPRFHLKVAYGNLPTDWSHHSATIITPRDDAGLADFYRSVDIMIAAGTVQHGAPHYPVLEAMACGTPVVNTGYLPATPENSWLAQPKSSQSLVDTVRQIVADPRPSSRTNRALASVKEFEWQTVAERMMLIFEGYR
jgi:glycosyltransferase involved in cell wall biosynthesis